MASTGPSKIWQQRKTGTRLRQRLSRYQFGQVEAAHYCAGTTQFKNPENVAITDRDSSGPL